MCRCSAHLRTLCAVFVVRAPGRADSLGKSLEPGTLMMEIIRNFLKLGGGCSGGRDQDGWDVSG